MLDKQASKVRVITIQNPFDVSQRDIRDVDYIHGLSLGGYVGEQEGLYVVSLNGGIVEEHDLNLTYPTAEDTVVICPIPLGGGGGSKGILRMVATIALVVVTAGYGAAFAGALGVTSAAGVAAVQAGLMLGGTLLINAILPPAVPSMGGMVGTNNIESSPTYGIDGAKNTAKEDMPVPLCFGGYRMSGNIIAMHTENASDTQYLYMLVNAGEGPIAGISNIKLNGQPIESYEEASYVKRLGTDNQAAIPWFNETLRAASLARKVTPKWSTYITSGEVDKLRLDFVAPSGLVTISSNTGDYYNRTVTIQIQIRKVGTSRWIEMPIPRYTGNGHIKKFKYHELGYVADGTEYKDEAGNIIRRSTGAYVGYWWEEEFTEDLSTSATASQTTPVRFSTSSARLEEAEYEVRWRRTNEESIGKYNYDSVTLTDINEIVTDSISYNFTALLAIRIKLTDQLNGIPNVTFTNEGIICKVYDEASRQWITKPTQNPAWIAFNIMTNERYGGGLSVERIDMVKLREWAKFCDDQELSWRGVIDTDGNQYDHLAHVFRAGHAKTIMVGTRYSFAIEKPDLPVMMFSEANIVEDSFSIDWLSMEDRANEIEVTFFDEANDFERKTIKVYDEVAFASGEGQRTTSITIIGCTREKDAYYEGQLALNVNRNIKQTVSFDASINAIACTIGDVIYVQHNMPQWGHGGKIMPESTRSVIHLDISTDHMADSNTNILLIKGSARKVGQGVINRIVGNFVYLSGVTTEPSRVRRMIIKGVDIEIGNVDVHPTLGVGFELEDIEFASIGATAELWDTDFFEEREILSFTDTSVTLKAPLSFTPEPYSDYMVGVSGKIKKPFRVLGVDYSHEYTRTIRAIEYNATLVDRWTYVQPTPNYSDLKPMGNSTIDHVTEELILVGSSIFETKVTVNFSNKSDFYHNSIVQIAKSGEAYNEVGRHFGRVTFRAEEGITYFIRVIAVDATGKILPAEKAPVKSYFVLGKVAPPDNVKELTVSRTSGGLMVEWRQNADVDLKQYVIRQGKSWGNHEKEWIVSGTSLFVPIQTDGVYSFHAIAEDTTGNRSEAITSESIELLPPLSVAWVDASQIGDRITITWKSPGGNGIAGYEIRAGRTWGGSRRVARVDTTSYTFDIDGFGERTYWVKAIDIVGLQSVTPRFVTLDVARTSDRNLVMSFDHESLLYNGLRINLDGSDNLIMKSGVKYGEYLAPLVLPERTRARNIIYMDSYSVADFTIDWDAADFSWEDSQALNLWESSGDSDSTETAAGIAIKHDGKGKDLLALSFNDTPKSESGLSPIENVKTTYARGRFFNGVKLTDNSKLTYQSVNIPAEFNVRFWITPGADSETRSSHYWRGVTAAGKFIWLQYDAVVSQFVLLSSDGIEQRVNLAVSSVDRVLVAISQSGTKRRLMAGRASGEFDASEVEAKPIGVINRVELTL